MESWQKVWREGLAPQISAAGLEALRGAAGGDDLAAAPAVRAGVARRGGLRPGLLRLAGRSPGERGRGRGVLRPEVLRGRPDPGRARRLPLVPQLVRRDAARPDAPAAPGRG